MHSVAEATDDAIAAKTLQLVVAGHDTTRIALGAMLTLLPQLPQHIHEELAGEQQRVVEAHGQGLSVAALGDMPYAEGVINEVCVVMYRHFGVMLGCSFAF
jgi:cytochrome P450